MARRTSITDAEHVSEADDLEQIVQDKRAGWRQSGAKARRRQRRYQNLLTQHLTRIGDGSDDMGRDAAD